MSPPPDPPTAHPAEVGAAAQVFVADLEHPEPSPDDAHHLARVLRLRPGQRVVAADGRGGWRQCRYAGTAVPAGQGPVRAVIEVDGPITVSPRPVPEIAVGFAAIKGERPEWVVQKLTEAGVDRIAVLRSTRTVVRWDDDRSARALERLRRVTREAAAQSRRAWLPEVVGLLDLDDMAALVAPLPLALAHPGGDPPSVDLPAVAVGPEGGWDETELGAGTRPTVGLGPGILRTETAAVAAGVLLCAIRNGLVGEVRRPSPGLLEGHATRTT